MPQVTLGTLVNLVIVDSAVIRDFLDTPALVRPDILAILDLEFLDTQAQVYLDTLAQEFLDIADIVVRDYLGTVGTLALELLDTRDIVD